MFGFLPGPCGCANHDARSAWQSHFCGLCNTLRARYGLWSRWLINRDSTFLSLTGSALAPDPPPRTRTTCCNPLGKRRLLVQHEPQMHYAAAVTVCGLAVKLRDDAGDERGLRRAGARAGRWLLRGAERIARADLEAGGFPVDEVAHDLSGQECVEATGASLAEAAAPTARAFGTIFGHLAGVCGAPAESAVTLTTAGAALGRMIYAVDAWEDYEADRRRRRFNPLPSGGEARRELVACAVQKDLGILAGAVAELPLRRHQSLLGSLAGPRLQQRALTRLGIAGPPPLPPLPPPLPPDEPVPAGGPMPAPVGQEKKSGGCSDWCVGCPGLCCCGSRARGGGSWCCLPVPDCDCDCPCDCSF
jgi:Family of unknown function (DUF5685)